MRKISEKILLTLLYLLDNTYTSFQPPFHNFTDASQQVLKFLKLVLKIFLEYFRCFPQNQSELATELNHFVPSQRVSRLKKIITMQN